MPLVRGHHSFEDHYTQIPNAWVRDPRLSFKARGLLVLIMSHRSGWSISLKSLARDNDCGIDSIRSSVNELLEAGYLVRSKERERDDKGQLGDFTYVTSDPASGNPTLENPTLDNPTPKKTITKEEHELKKHAQVELEREFDEFWKFYPRRVGKQAALKAFAKARTSNEFATIMQGARRFAADENKPPMQYLPHPATWLNEGRWDDEPYPEREKSKEERQQEALDKYQRDRQAALEASRRLREEMQEAKRKAEENPPEYCEHDRIKVLCKKCPTPPLT